MSFLTRLTQLFRARPPAEPAPAGELDELRRRLNALDQERKAGQAERARLVAELEGRAEEMEALRSQAMSATDRLEEIAAQRKALVAQCIDLADQIGSELLVARIRETLESVGVRTIEADGDPVDYRRHVSVDATPTPDRDQDGTVAETARVGYCDGEEVIRQPEVVIYRYEGV
jgi:molecular chaperone GrpE (heat shock protein)